MNNKRLFRFSLLTDCINKLSNSKHRTKVTWTENTVKYKKLKSHEHKSTAQVHL